MSDKSETRDFLTFLVKLALFVFVLRSFIVAPFNIPSESMQPRLLKATARSPRGTAPRRPARPSRRSFSVGSVVPYPATQLTS